MSEQEEIAQKERQGRIHRLKSLLHEIAPEQEQLLQLQGQLIVQHQHLDQHQAELGESQKELLLQQKGLAAQQHCVSLAQAELTHHQKSLSEQQFQVSGVQDSLSNQQSVMLQERASIHCCTRREKLRSSRDHRENVKLGQGNRAHERNCYGQSRTLVKNSVRLSEGCYELHVPQGSR